MAIPHSPSPTLLALPRCPLADRFLWIPLQKPLD